MKFILGSQSPRRYEILSYFSIPFEQMNSDFDEETITFTGDPQAYAKEIAYGKAVSLSSKYPEAIILTADTVVYKDGKIFGKPQNKDEAFRTLTALSDSWHSVFTAVTVVSKGQFYEGSEETKVLFNFLTATQIERYLEALHWADKAGGYAIQLAGSLIVRRIEGCYYNVVGLPIYTVYKLLNKAGIDLWDYLK